MLKKVAIVVTLILLLHQTLSKHIVKTEVFLSPEIILEPGLVSNKNYYNIDFPKAHIALKGFTAELVDAAGNPVPLHETYLHHWLLRRYYSPKDNGNQRFNYTIVRNSGLCESGLTYYYGVGAETRQTSTDIPDPYGIHIGDPSTIPPGYEEGWILTIHAIDTRGTLDVMGCSECRCDLYDVERESLPWGYKGGFKCCDDENRCRLKQGFHGERRKLYLRYSVKYVDWDPLSIVPVNIYVLDVVDHWTKGDQNKGIKETHDCKIEYDVDACDDVGVDKNGCVDRKVLSVIFPSGGDVIYGVGHQHAGGIGVTLYGEGGRTICSSNPKYGQGKEAGNEAGFIVGMSTCYPSPEELVRISVGETLTLVSNYSTVRAHTGVMGIFYLLLADSSPRPSPSLANEITNLPNFVWPMVLLGVLLVLVAALARKGKNGKEDGYEAIP